MAIRIEARCCSFVFFLIIFLVSLIKMTSQPDCLHTLQAPSHVNGLTDEENHWSQPLINHIVTVSFSSSKSKNTNVKHSKTSLPLRHSCPQYTQ